jgi:peptidyl-prolyl cis-trans isomerase D
LENSPWQHTSFADEKILHWPNTAETSEPTDFFYSIIEIDNNIKTDIMTREPETIFQSIHGLDKTLLPPYDAGFNIIPYKKRLQMLSSMRKSAGSWMIKILLGLIVVAFVFTGAGSFYSNKDAQVAKVNGRPISIDEYQRTYYSIMQNLEQRFGNRLNQDLLDMLNVKDQALNELIEKHLLLQVASENGVRVPDSALAQAITGIPVFQNNGRFDPGRYRRLLEQNRMSPEGFETMQKESMKTSIIRNMVAGTIAVSDMEARAWFNWRNTEIKIDYAVFSGSQYPDMEVSEQELAQYFEAQKENYKTEPALKVRYLCFDPQDFKDQVSISDEEIRNYYESHPDEFSTPETVTARHILFQLPEDADEDAVAEAEKKAMEIMKKARQGEDFAELAKKHSQGPTAKDGGFLGSFQRQDMVKPFSDKAFSMKPGDISDPVRTQFGWHIIKVEDRQKAAVKPLEEVKGKILEKLTQRQARTLAYDNAWSLYEISFEGEDLAKNANDLGLKLETTEFFTNKTGPEKIENAGVFAKKAFELPLSEISEVIEIGDSFFLIQPVERQEPEIPQLEEIKEKVTADLIKQKQKEAAQKAAEKFLKQVKNAKTFADFAKTSDIEIKTTDFFKRNEPIDGIRNSRRLSEKAFSLDKSNPVADSVIEENGSFYVISLNDLKVPEEKEFESQKENAVADLRQQKRQQAINDWIASVRQASDIRISERFSD